MGATILGWYVQQNGGGGNDLEYAYIFHNTQANLNDAPVQWRNIQLNVATLDTNMTGLAAIATAITGFPDGEYYISGQSLLASNTGRVNLLYRVSINGLNNIPPTGASGYIRAAQGHNQSSVHVGGVFTLNNGNNSIGLTAIREANAGVINTSGPNGLLSIVRLA